MATTFRRLLYTLTEASEVTGIGLRTLTYAVSDGRLKSIFNNGRRRVRAEDLEAFATADAPRRSTSRATRDASELPEFTRRPAVRV